MARIFENNNMNNNLYSNSAPLSWSAFHSIATQPYLRSDVGAVIAWIYVRDGDDKSRPDKCNVFSKDSNEFVNDRIRRPRRGRQILLLHISI